MRFSPKLIGHSFGPTKFQIKKKPQLRTLRIPAISLSGSARTGKLLRLICCTKKGVSVAFIIGAFAFVEGAQASTTMTNTRPEVAQMAALWEADSIQISPLADAQYPQFGSSLWQFIFPHSKIGRASCRER